MNIPSTYWIRSTAIVPLLSMVPSLMMYPALAPREVMVPQRQPRHHYPPEEIQAFMAECIGAAQAEGIPEDRAQAYLTFSHQLCTCMIWQIQDRYTANSARAINEGLINNAPWANAARDEVITACFPASSDPDNLG